MLKELAELLAFSTAPAPQSGFNDAFKPAVTSFEDSFDNKASGFGDDDWHGSSWNNQQNDPFGGSKPDPFGAPSNDASAKDVS
jgi:hypothetical protein